MRLTGAEAMPVGMRSRRDWDTRFAVCSGRSSLLGARVEIYSRSRNGDEGDEMKEDECLEDIGALGPFYIEP
jgi:hypothetical protein